jgi:hypothetical protein
MKKATNGAGSLIYMGAPVALTTLPNGALTNVDAQNRLKKTSYIAPERSTFTRLPKTI